MVYRYVNIALESFSLLICLILVVYMLVEKKEKNQTNRWFDAMVLSNMCMLVGDLSDWIFGGMTGAVYYYLQYILSILVYFTASGLLLFSLYGWLISIISQKAKISPNWMRVGRVALALQILLVATMPLHKLCYIDADNYYARGDLFFLTQLCPYIVYGLAIFLLLIFRKTFSFKERIYLVVFITVPFFAEMIQVATYKYATLNVAVSVGLILVFTFIQSEREYDNERRIKELILNENRKLEEMQSLQENLSEQLIEVLCGTVEAKDHYTRGHSLRVAQYAREIMYRMGGSEKEQQEVYYIGILHDVGKISVRDEIINKKGKLTEEEYEQIKLHTVAGYQILRGVDVIPNLAIGARWHHERYDGKGYPNGLEGENIPLVARIISVADAYDAMTSNRSYHSAMPQQKVRSEIEKGMGTQFDPNIAKIMLEMIDEDLQYEMKQINSYNSTSILLIDDDMITHTLVQHALIEEPYDLTSAYSGKEGIEQLRENKYDLVLLDMEMPDMHGFEVLDWIMKNLRKTKVIFLTGDKSIATIKRMDECGASDYITKPVNANILKESIHGVLCH